MVTVYSQREVDAKARALADLLFQAVIEPDFLEPAWEAYCRVRETLVHRGLAAPADVPNDESIKRLLFEVITFAAFIVMGQEVPKWLRRKSPLGGEEPDVEWIRHYNRQFLDRIGHHVAASQFTQLREVTLATIQPEITFAHGEPLSVVRRVSGYLHAGSAAEAARDFSQFAALAMEAEHSPLLQPITLRLVESVVGVSRILLKGVFTRQLAPKPLIRRERAEAAPLDPLEQNLERYLKAPGYVDALGKTYWLGTDQQGRDILSRVIWGSRVSLVVGITTVVLSGLIGVFLGILAGYKGGWIDAMIGRIIDTLFAVPFILLAMSLIAILGTSLQNIILAIALRTWIIYARVVRGETLSLRAQEFVAGAKAMGCGTTRILLFYLLPNVMASTIVVATLNLGRMIIIESSLSFLGLGVPPPTPTWGGMLAEGRVFVDTAWWITFFPGAVLMLTVLGTNLLGDWLRDVLDPRLKRLGD